MSIDGPSLVLGALTFPLLYALRSAVRRLAAIGGWRRPMPPMQRCRRCGGRAPATSSICFKCISSPTPMRALTEEEAERAEQRQRAQRAQKYQADEERRRNRGNEAS